MSDASHDYTIKLKLDRSEERAGNEAALAELKRIETEEKRLALERDKLAHQTTEAKLREERRAAAEAANLGKKLLTDEQIQAKARAAAIAELNREKIRTSTEAFRVEHEGLNVTARLAGSVNSTLVGWSQGAVSVALVGQAIGALGQGLEKARERAKEVASEIRITKESLQELALLWDRKPDSQFSREIINFGVSTGLPLEKSNAFLKQLSNSGKEFVGPDPGAHLTEGQFEQYKGDVGRVAAASGIDPAVIGDLAGVVIASQDWRQKGSKAALGEFFSAFKGMARGRGQNATIFGQLARTVPQVVNPDPEKGIFGSIREAVPILSTLAEVNPEEIETMLRASVRGLMERKGTEGEFNAAAGITGKMPFQTKLELLNTAVAKRMKETGETQLEVLSEAYPDERVHKGLAGLLTRGIQGGVIADRQRYMLEQGGADKAVAYGAEYVTDQEGPGPLNVAEARKKQVEFSKYAANAKIKALRTDAETNLIERRKIDTASEDFSDALTDTFGFMHRFGLTEKSREQSITTESWSMLNRRAAALGMTLDAPGRLDITPEVNAEKLSNAFEAVQRAEAARDVDTRPIVEAQRETNRLLQKAANRPLPAGARGHLPTISR